jgi:hypothetical protein
VSQLAFGLLFVSFFDRAQISDRFPISFAADGFLGGNQCVDTQDAEIAIGEMVGDRSFECLLIATNAGNL